MKRPISVLHARVVTGSGGGPDKTILRSASYLPHDRFDVASVYLHPAGDPGTARLWDIAHAHGMPRISIPERGAIDRRAIRQLVDLCRRRKVDIWHSHDYKTDVLGLLIRRMCPGLRLVSTVHGFTRENLKTRFYARLNDMALRHYDHVFAVSPMLTRHCAEHGVAPSRLSYLPNAIELDSYPMRCDHDHRGAREALGTHPGRPAIAMLGRLSKEKGVDRALHLFREIRTFHTAAVLHLIGNGPEYGRLESLAKAIGVRDAVVFHGWSSDPAPILRGMDLLLSTSHREGMPNALLEAMAMGVPIAASAVGGVPEMLDHGRCGQLLTPGDVAAWPSQMLPLLSPSPERSAMLMHARQRIESEYSFSERMRRVRTLYESIHTTRLKENRRAA
ncbi:MAG: glycosyltransferase [Phycisphaerales bacterium JB063]